MCPFNDTATCKFGEKCLKRHFQNICFRTKCNRKCGGRHPRFCKFGQEYEFLRKNICAYKHDNSAIEGDEIKALKTKLNNI